MAGKRIHISNGYPNLLAYELQDSLSHRQPPLNKQNSLASHYSWSFPAAFCHLRSPKQGLPSALSSFLFPSASSLLTQPSAPSQDGLSMFLLAVASLGGSLQPSRSHTHVQVGLGSRLQPCVFRVLRWAGCQLGSKSLNPLFQGALLGCHLSCHPDRII